jgi:Trypsin-co-occurring domain 1
MVKCRIHHESAEKLALSGPKPPDHGTLRMHAERKEGGEMATVEIAPIEGVAPIVKGLVPIRIEVPDPPDEDSADFYSDVETRGIVKQAAKAVAKTAQQIYEEAIEMACEAAAQTARRLADMNERDKPDEFEVEFGLSLGTGVDTKIVNINSGAQVQVRMQWNRGSGA